MKDWLKDLLTDENGNADETGLYALAGVIMFNVLALVSVIRSPTGAFDMQAYGIGFGAILAAVLAGYGVKAKLERKPTSGTTETVRTTEQPSTVTETTTTTPEGGQPEETGSK